MLCLREGGWGRRKGYSFGFLKELEIGRIRLWDKYLVDLKIRF